MQRLFIASKKYIITILFMVTFVFTLLNDIPASMLGKIIAHYSHSRLQLYNPDGTFWHGSGLLVIYNEKSTELTPLILVNWAITPGLHKFIDIKFNVGDTPIADLYLDKHGANLDNLDLSLSIIQVSQVFDIIGSLGLSGNIEVLSHHIQMGNKMNGALDISLNSVSSSLSPINPLGSYKVNMDLSNGAITVKSDTDATLYLEGVGNFQGLTLKCRLDPKKKDKMLEFVTVMGVPQADGSFQMKIF